MLAARHGGNSLSFLLMLMDLDRFREIYTAFGHACGDVLLYLAARLQGILRESDRASCANRIWSRGLVGGMRAACSCRRPPPWAPRGSWTSCSWLTSHDGCKNHTGGSDMMEPALTV